MSVIELIGFVISLLALFFLFFRQAMEEKKRQKDPEGYAKEQERKAKLIENLLLGQDEDEEEEIEEEAPHELEEWEMPKPIPVQPLPPPTPVVVRAPLEVPLTTTRIHEIVSSLDQKRDLVVFQTLFGPPKGL